MPTRTRSLTVAAIIAVIFGLLTIVSGGRALFGGADMGAVVPFVLWFNFLAGFAYVAAGLASGIAPAGQQASRLSSHWRPQPSSRPFSGRSRPGQLLKPAPWVPWGCALPSG